MLRHVAEGDCTSAYELVDTLLDQGWEADRIVTRLLVDVQREVGARWQAGRWNVAREHAATSVIDDLLGALGRHVPQPRSHATVALVCAEGEWHVTPARMAVLLLRSHGWPTTFLGGSTPTEHLQRDLERSRPTFVAVSCTYPLFLPGAGEVATLARRLEIPTIAGGRAFGTSDERALRLGFDGWAKDIEDASMMLGRWLDGPPAQGPPAEGYGWDERHLMYRWTGIADQAIQRLASAAPSRLDHDAGTIEMVRHDLVELLRAAHVAAVCDDPSLFTDHVDWMRAVHPARGLPHEALDPSILILRSLSPQLGDRTAAILASV